MSERFPEPLNSCAKCLEHYFGEPGLSHAFASVGIERGKSSWQMAEAYFTDFHRRKHKEPPQ